MHINHPVVTTEKAYYSDRELASVLSVSPRTIRRMWMRGELPSPVVVGQLNRWPVVVIRDWMATRPQNDIYRRSDADTIS